MNDRLERFDVGELPRVAIRLAAANVFVTEGGANVVEVLVPGSHADRVLIEHFGDEVRIGEDRTRRSRGSFRIALKVPVATELETGMASGSVDVQGEIAELQSKTASGGVSVKKVGGDAGVKAASGEIDIESVAGRARLVAASGDLSLAQALGDVSCVTASGDIRLGEVNGQLDMKTASGDATVEVFRGELLKAKSVSGDLVVGLPAGRRVKLQLRTLSGAVELPDAKPVSTNQTPASVRIYARSVSGDIRIVRRELD